VFDLYEFTKRSEVNATTFKGAKDRFGKEKVRKENFLCMGGRGLFLFFGIVGLMP